MERITKSTWNEQFRSKDLSALMLVLFLTLAVVAVLVIVLF